jgi:CRISPR-associated protein Csd1
MSWIQELYKTYNNCQAMIGDEPNEKDVPLLPICHTTQKAHIEVVIDGDGNFKRAKVVPKDDARTIIPCTEKSSGRTSGESPHPLCDKLQYVAKDYSERGGSKKAYSASFIQQLEAWCNSEFSTPKIFAILKYVKKGKVIEDLIDHQVLFVEKNEKLVQKWDKKHQGDAPEIFEVLSQQPQQDAFIRWVVVISNQPESKVWHDSTLWEKWIGYYTSTRQKHDLCYASGKTEIVAEQHLAKLRNDGDKAKLISSNDASGFTFRGRFLTADQAATVGLDATQKAHLVLRWLISRQGYRKGDLAIVAWEETGKELPQPGEDLFSILEIDNLEPDDPVKSSTAQELAVRLKKRIAGYGKQIEDTAGIIVIGVDSATTGRLAIIYYRKLTNSEFLERLDDWHNTCVWFHRYRSSEVVNPANGKIQKKVIPFVGAPSPSDIAEAAYGRRLDDKLRKATVTRLLPCIVDGQPIPRDLVESAFRRACNRVGMENWEWNKTLSIACALFKKFKHKEDYSMTLDPNRKTRDYLYGRLLALAENLESWALSSANEDRPTNAARLMQRFSERPYSTWRTIELALTPSKARLGGKSTNRQRMIDEVIGAFNPDDFLSDKRLSGEFLLGYHCQRKYLWNLVSKNKVQNDENIEDSNNQ